MLLKWMLYWKRLIVESTAFEEKGHDEINIMECQWSEGLYKQGIFRLFQKADADIFAYRKARFSPGKLSLNLTGIIILELCWEERIFRYCGVTRIKPLCVQNGIGIDEHDREGRVITLEFDNYYLVNVYTPNAKKELERLDYRMKWEDDFRNYLVGLKAKSRWLSVETWMWPIRRLTLRIRNPTEEAPVYRWRARKIYGAS